MREGGRPRRTDAATQPGEQLDCRASVPGEGVHVAVVASQFGGEEPRPRLESYIALRLKRSDGLFSEDPGGVPFAAEQLDDGEVEQRTGHPWPVVDSLAPVERNAGEPPARRHVARGSGQKSEVGKANVFSTAIAQLLADA